MSASAHEHEPGDHGPRGRRHGIRDFRRAELRSSGGELSAAFVPDAGMVGWSLRHRGVELLVHPVSLQVHVSQGELAGIPLLHPWANRLASPEYEIAGRRGRLDLSAPSVHTDPGGLPIHGLVIGCPYWQVLEHTTDRLRAELNYDAWPELLAAFPFPHRLELTVALSDRRMSVSTELVATAETPVPVAFGFHPYLRVPGIARERWLLELPVTSRMVLDERMLPTGRSEPVTIPPEPLGDRAFDDAFDGLADPAEFAISGAGRRVSVRVLDGYRFAQVYAPPGSGFVCFEPMTAPVNPFESGRTPLVDPGSAHLARFEIGVGPSRPE